MASNSILNTVFERTWIFIFSLFFRPYPIHVYSKKAEHLTSASFQDVVCFAFCTLTRRKSPLD